MLTELYHFIRDFEWNVGTAAALTVGLLIGGGLIVWGMWFWRKHLGKHGAATYKI